MAIFAVIAATVSTPEKTLNTFCSDLKSGDYHGAYQQFSPAFQQTSGNSEQEFTTTLKSFFASAGGLKDCTVSNVNSTGPNGTGVMTWTVNKSTNPAVFDVSLIDDHRTWKINNIKGRNS